MEEFGHPARVDTRFVSVQLRIPILEGEVWRELTNDQAEKAMTDIAESVGYAAAVIEAMLIDPELAPFVRGLFRTTAMMVREETNQDEEIKG